MFYNIQCCEPSWQLNFLHKNGTTNTFSESESTLQWKRNATVTASRLPATLLLSCHSVGWIRCCWIRCWIRSAAGSAAS